jgi:hypothetical protein
MMIDATICVGGRWSAWQPIASSMEWRQVTPNIFTLSGALSSTECQEMINFSEAQGFEAATIIAPGGPRLDREVRNNDRVTVDDPNLAGRIWNRVEAFLPRMLLGRHARGLNERFRFYRYAPGQKFSWHADLPFQRENGELSLLTFMIYLNDTYEGGATRFETLELRGQTGMALVFEHGLIHEGGAVLQGRKYVMRSDVMYGPLGVMAG